MGNKNKSQTWKDGELWSAILDGVVRANIFDEKTFRKKQEWCLEASHADLKGGWELPAHRRGGISNFRWNGLGVLEKQQGAHWSRYAGGAQITGTTILALPAHGVLLPGDAQLSASATIVQGADLPASKDC